MSDRSKHLDFLRRTAREAVWSGDFDRALRLLEEGLALARGWKLRESEDIFLCNRVATLVEMERNDFDLATLKEVVLRHPEGRLGAFAAYTAACAHELRREHAKARIYAQMAITRSEGTQPYLKGVSLNLLGSLDVSESQFQSALPLFREALEIYAECPQDTTREAAVAEDNMGYVYIACDEVSVGLPIVERALNQFDAMGARAFTTFPNLDLCLGHLKLEQYEEAEHRGIQALALGQEFHQEKVIKNSHYLLGEIYSEVGRRGDADQHFDALSKFYPDFPALKGFLHQVNVVGMINLRA
jgi:tetratricopeptide (TPR) repeat protein